MKGSYGIISCCWIWWVQFLPHPARGALAMRVVVVLDGVVLWSEAFSQFLSLIPNATVTSEK